MSEDLDISQVESQDLDTSQIESEDVGTSQTEGEDLDTSQLEAVKEKYEPMLMEKKNVVGVGIGFREREGQLTDELVLTVMVTQKQPRLTLRSRDRIPAELDGVPVDVKQVGRLRAF